MISKSKRAAVISVFLVPAVIGSARRARAVIPVIDGAAVAKLAIEVGKMAQVYEQLKASYNLAKQMSQVFTNMPSYYRDLIVSTVTQLNPANCPQCSVWASAANTGLSVTDQTYGGVVGRLAILEQIMARLDGSGQARMNARLANSVYLPQAVVNRDLEVLGNRRMQDPMTQEAIQNCRSSALDGSLVSQVQTAQVSNGCAAVMVQTQNSSNVLLSRILEHQSVDAARRMDEEVQRLNYDAAWRASAAEEMPAGAGQVYRDLLTR
jgi:hypothetical protein